MCDRASKKLQTIVESLNSMDEEPEYFVSHLGFDGFEPTGESSDLELAAEIGKALLERNHELEVLLKTTQDFAEEEANQSLHLARQVELLRESNESKSRLCQQFDNQLQDLNERHGKLKAEHWTLQGRYRKVCETNEILEKKCEDFRDEIEKLKAQEETYSKTVNNDTDYRENDVKSEREVDILSEDIFKQESDYLSLFSEERDAEIEAMKDELDSLYKSFLDSQDRLDCETRRREELENEVKDTLHENDLLRQRAIDLENEILEWQDIAHRAEQYQKLADRYCSGWDLSSEDCNYTVLTFDTKLINVNKNTPTNDKNSQEDFKNITKPSLQESTSPDRDLTPTRENEDRRIEIENQDKSNNVKCNPPSDSSDNRSNNISLLSELDTQYKEMVKRYESLLEKCKSEGKITDDPVRTKKVQRAIQTLSLDLSYITSPLSPTNKSFQREGKCPRCSSASGSKSYLNGSNENLLDSAFDYRMMFAEIFTKLKESKDYDPSQIS